MVVWAFCFLPSLSEAWRKKSRDERRFSLAPALLVVCRQPSRNPLGRHRGRHECFDLLSRLLRCLRVCALTAMTRQLGNGDPRRTVPGLWGTSRRVIGWVLTDSSGRQPVPGKEQCSPGISPCLAALQGRSSACPPWPPRPLAIRSGTPGPGHDVSPWWTDEWPDDMVSQNTRDWYCLARFSSEHQTNSRVFLT